MATIRKIADVSKGKMMLDSLTGFNEGITEMFAQDYLKAEIKNGYDFKGENQHLATSKKIVRPRNSYVHKCQ